MPYRPKRPHKSTMAAAPSDPSNSSNSTTACFVAPAGGAMLTRGVSRPWAHTGGVDVLVGTGEGLFHLSNSGIAPVSSTGTRAIADEWALVEGDDIVSLDSGVTATTAPLSAHCVAAFGDGALVGT